MNTITASTSYLRSVWDELRRVKFPNQRQVVRRTILVLIAIAVMGGLIALIDTGITQLLKQFIFNK